MNALPLIDLKDASSFPSRRVEAWKYSDLRRHLREAPAPSPSAAVPVTGGGPFEALGGEAMVFINGRAVGASALMVSGQQTVRLRFISKANGTGHALTARLSVRAGAKLLLLETHEGHGSAYVAHNRLELDVARGAEVTRVVLADEPADAVSITQAQVRVEAGGFYRQTILTGGAKLQRQETQLTHRARGADVQLDSVYLLSGDRQTDLTTVVDHVAPNGVTSQLTKGVVRDTARGVFQGKIVVERGADGTDARMGHHALILGERAEVDAKPELEIYADDVQCAHGNTVGNLDESALFYMQQRGIPADEARALLTEAFLIEVVDRIEHEGAREVARAWLTDRL
ncbi:MULTISPECIES: Fe-S cluster assembly protein SufD [unclassified Brevundimonas]|uniref:Fe-S cluster assembly protein SufD n=1 Tax=unclassified Brevundimonas TaxID=2622653 RepID=UPI0006F7DD53|nr:MULTISPECIES: Fe-S cluster assembly protein SufD [unclassified Brevundimonas]KQY82916.1 ABC transporter permease [Brevundimonas sp. Root1423]KRA29172.1 ABC transporter permease [Brevundimonas sp. Root608]